MLNTLIIALVWPEPDASAAGAHMMDLIRALKPISRNITFACTAKPSVYSANLEISEVHGRHIKVNDPGFDEFIKELRPDVVIFDRFMAEEQFSWRVRKYCPDALRILNTEDLHGLRKGREIEISLENKNPGTIDLNDVMKREIASLYRSDLNLIISTSEIEFLRDQFSFKTGQLHYFPLLTDLCDQAYCRSLPGFDQRGGFVTIGNFKHPPNQDSVKYLKYEIWPEIRRSIPEAEIRIYGSYMGQEWSRLHDKAGGFLMMGHVERSAEALQESRVLLAPLRFGAGLKGKLMDAMLNGLPFVTMPAGLDGFEIGAARPGLTADNAKDFVELAVRLYEDKSMWEQIREEGFNLINTHFNRSIHQELLTERIEKAFSELRVIRKTNKLSEIFWHQSLRSTEFMSRWIELKNTAWSSGPVHGTYPSHDQISQANTENIVREGYGNDKPTKLKPH